MATTQELAKAAAAKKAAAAGAETVTRKPAVRRPAGDVLADKKALLARVETKYTETVKRLMSQIEALENKAPATATKAEAVEAVKSGLTREQILANIRKQQALLKIIGDVTEEDLNSEPEAAEEVEPAAE